MEGRIESEQIRKILLVLARANSPAPLGYISLHTEIEELCKILRKMEGEGLVRRSLPSRWSCSMDPMYEITPTAQKELLQVLS